MIKLEKLEKGEFFEDAFLVSYRYNKDYLNKMRSLKYKRYVPDKKAWEIPSSELKHLVDLFGVDDINVNAKYLEGLTDLQKLSRKPIDWQTISYQSCLFGMRIYSRKSWRIC